MNEKQLRLSLYYLVIFLLSIGAFVFFEQRTRSQPSNYLYVEKCVLSLISSFFNVFVLYYHCTHAPHPKFLILFQRRFAIYVHIASGGVEFISCWLAFFTGSSIVAKLAASVAICGHIPTAYYQTASHFGAKGLIIPGYLFVISLHLFTALHLLTEPTSVFWLLNMFLVHNIYVWCRVLYFCFSYLGLFKDTRYTNTILTSVFILFPGVLGIAGNMFFLAYIAATILLYFAIVRPDPVERTEFVNESSRDLLVNKKTHSAWIKHRLRLVQLAEDDQSTDQERAKQVFDRLDEDKSGNLDGNEIDQLFKEWDVAQSFVKRFKSYSEKNPITFEVFYRHIWRLGETSTCMVEQQVQREGKAKAQFVFDILDSDRSGYIDAIELQKLLIQWGLPENEADAYLAKDADKQFSFDEFYEQLKPIWDFAYENMGIRHDQPDAQPTDHSHTD